MPVFTLESAPDGVSGEESFDRPTSTPVRIIPENTSVFVEVVAVVEVTKPFNDDAGQPVKRLEFEFRVLDGEYEKQRLWQEVYYEFNDGPKCRLRQWAQELFGMPLDPNFVLDTDTLVGMRANATVGIRYWTKQDGGSGEKNTVKFLSRLKEEQRSFTGSVAPATKPDPMLEPF